MPDKPSNIIIYNTADGKASVALYAREGKIWLNQQQMAALGLAALLCKELLATSKQLISHRLVNIFKDKKLLKMEVIKRYLTTGVVQNYITTEIG